MEQEAQNSKTYYKTYSCVNCDKKNTYKLFSQVDAHKDTKKFK